MNPKGEHQQDGPFIPDKTGFLKSGPWMCVVFNHPGDCDSKVNVEKASNPFWALRGK